MIISVDIIGSRFYVLERSIYWDALSFVRGLLALKILEYKKTIGKSLESFVNVLVRDCYTTCLDISVDLACKLCRCLAWRDGWSRLTPPSFKQILKRIVPPLSTCKLHSPNFPRLPTLFLSLFPSSFKEKLNLSRLRLLTSLSSLVSFSSNIWRPTI